MRHTTSQQDDEIRKAQGSDHINNLVAIIEDLDDQIAKWIAACGYSSPEELEAHLRSINDT